MFNYYLIMKPRISVWGELKQSGKLGSSLQTLFRVQVLNPLKLGS